MYSSGSQKVSPASYSTYTEIHCVIDPAFKALQDLTSNNAKIASAESTIRACEDELAKLSSLNAPGISSWWINPIGNRSRYLLKKLKDAEKSLEKLEAANADLKKILSKTS